MILGAIFLAALLASYAVTAWLLHNSRISGLVDQPNQRSSHSTPTPRGGGLSMVAVTSGGVIILYATAGLPLSLTAALILGGVSVAAVGFWDDVRSAPIAARIMVHFGAAALAVYCLGGATAVRAADFITDLGVAGQVLCVFAIVWVLNLFNFMDGIDGIAASEAAFILLGATGLSLCFGNSSPTELAPALIAGGASLGFLKWNWPPARIFMGDIGSGYLGYVIAVLGLESTRTSAVNVYAWIILGGVFLTDATVTLARRVLRGERVHHAHRTHAYQWLSRRWCSHARVTSAVVAVDVFWLLPCAACAVYFPHFAFWICIVALTPLVAGALLSGAGRAE